MIFFTPLNDSLSKESKSVNITNSLRAYNYAPRFLKNNTLPVATIKFSNGSLMNFSSLYEAALWLLEEFKNNDNFWRNIMEINILPIEYVKNITNNSEYMNGYEVFFVRNISEDLSLNESLLATSNFYAYHQCTYGSPYTVSPLYGPLTALNITLINGSKLTIDDFKEITILIYLNMSDEIAVNKVKTWIVTLYEQILNEFGRESLRIILIDIANEAKKIPEELQNYGVLLALDSNTSILLNASGSFLTFGFRDLYPAFVYLFRNYVWRKSIGLEAPEVSIAYLSQVIKKGIAALSIYPIINITGWDLYELSPGYIGIQVGEGYGNTTLKVYYKILDASNATLTTGSFEKNVTEPGIYSFKIDLIPNNSRTIIVDVQMISQFGFVISKSVTLKVISEVKLKEKEEKKYWELWIAIAIVMILIILFGIITTKWISPKGERRRKRRVKT